MDLNEVKTKYVLKELGEVADQEALWLPRKKKKISRNLRLGKFLLDS